MGERRKPGKPKKSAKATKRTTKKRVQASENRPPPPPVGTVSISPEPDDDPAGDDGLTEKQRRFVHYYMGEAAGNATKAARLAGYRDDNYNVLAVTAHRVLIKANVQRALARERGRRFGSVEDVKIGIAAIADGSAADMLEPGKDGELHVSLKALAESGALGTVQQIQEERLEVGGEVATVKVKVKLYDKLKALEMLAKMNGQYVERQDVTSGGAPVKVYVVASPDDWDKPKAAGESPEGNPLPVPAMAGRPLEGPKPGHAADG